MKLDDVEASDIEVRRGGAGGKAAKVGIPSILVLIIGFVMTQMGGGGGGGASSLPDILGELQGGGAASGQGEIVDGQALEGQQEFTGKVMTLLDDYWVTEAPKLGVTYRKPTFVVFDGPTQTGGCGVGTPEAGPFYCPGDDNIYIDLGFYKKLEQQLDFDGDFAMAYVMAHEFGHHIQNLEGNLGGGRSNAESVRVELQADCYAGAWGHFIDSEGRISVEDFNDAIRAANAVGDDAIQGANANQDTFTHGSSAQREAAFRTGFDSGDPRSCRFNR